MKTDFINHHTVKGEKEPVLLSSPHSGTEFPPEVKKCIQKDFHRFPKDTDWKVDELYSFVEELGIERVHSKYSRYVVDLNRSPENQQLYSDQRLQTSVVPVQSFAQDFLYTEGTEPNSDEVNRRVNEYFLPYHQKIEHELSLRKKNYKHVLLFDAHSIKRQISSIRSEPFPDMIIGTRDGTSCHPKLIDVAIDSLKNSPFDLTVNEPFKGGYITRSFGQPENGISAIQLEISQDIYLKNSEINSIEDVAIAPEKQNAFAATIRPMFERLIATLKDLNQ